MIGFVDVGASLVFYRAFATSSTLGNGTWRSLVSALVWGTRGRRFKSGRPDHTETALVARNSSPRR
jgi:hypothetical protein